MTTSFTPTTTPPLSENLKSTALSTFTLEEFEYLSQISSSNVPASDLGNVQLLAGQNHSSGKVRRDPHAHQKQDSGYEEESNQQSVRLSPPRDRTWTSYKPLPRINGDDNKGSYGTTPQQMVKRQFRQPVFQYVAQQEILVSDDEEDDEDLHARSPGVSADNLVLSNGRGNGLQYKTNGTDQAGHSLNGIKRIEEWKEVKPEKSGPQHTEPSENGWDTFQPTRMKVSSSTTPTGQPEAGFVIGPHPVICDKCGSILSGEARERQSTSLSLVSEALQYPSAAAPPSSPSSKLPYSNGIPHYASREPQEDVQEQRARPMNGLEPNLINGTGLEAAENPATMTNNFAACAALWKRPPSIPITTFSSSLSKFKMQSFQPLVPNFPPPLYSTENGRAPLNPSDLRSSSNMAGKKIPSDLLYGWGPEEDKSKATNEAIPPEKANGDVPTQGIGWDDDETSLPSKDTINNAWDPEFAFKKVLSPSYSVSSQHRSFTNVSRGDALHFGGGKTCLNPKLR